MSCYTDEISVLKDLARGDIEAFNYLYHKYHQRIYANIFKVVSVPDSAQDILQEVFMTLWNKREQLGNTENIGSWLFVVSYNKAISHLRAIIKLTTTGLDEIIENTLLADESSTHTEQTYSLQLALLHEAVDTLPSRKREVFKLCHYEGRSYDEVASMLGISVQSVKDYLKQSTAMIRSYVNNQRIRKESITVLGLIAVLAGS
ncbi:MAG: sigma-70 family RNA polymerase sigma factor [Candidatus Pseudobacter hemicellulosilyticus]|uniref:Sigma-70 family RNA polymerase sigma factor n=1 Tax=Candidatus Pseudobacter hemicellulosilyticus TaxID=3121375 RepID=A0AAJ5WTT9_9BACT|nr:MAG: sigma-70 family RNA polymerase sigma factor [Pseudobacter sp.]